MAKKGAGKGKAVGVGGGVGGGGGATPTPPKSSNQTIILLPTGGADPRTAKFSSAGKNKVRWDNQASRGLTVTFPSWPFVEAPAPIAIEAGRKSKWYNVIADVPMGKFTYVISPDLTCGDPAPDPPGISFNG